MNEPTHLCLFSGTGIPSLVMQRLGFRTVGYVEADPHCQACIRQRAREGSLDDAPIFPDVRAFDGLPYRGRVDLVSAGFPCQPFSVAGRKRAADDERNLWPDTARILGEVRPRVALLENVPGLLAGTHGYFGEILADLSELGFDARWEIVSAFEVGAPHLRRRLWIVAHARGVDLREFFERYQEAPWIEALARDDGPEEPVADAGGWRFQGQRSAHDDDGTFTFGNDADRCCADVADSAGARCEHICEVQARSEPTRRGSPSGSCWWHVEPDMGRVAHGVARRVVRLRALGNGWVPQQAVEAIRRIVT